MHVFAVKSDTFLSGNVVSGYSSMIWTERYLEPGDFELRTPLIEETRLILPEDGLIGIKESREVMIVESHEITEAEDGSVELLVKGRSFETVLEGRILKAHTFGSNWKMQDTYTAAEAAMVLAWNSVCNALGRDVTRFDFYGKSNRDVIPNVYTSLSTGIQTTNMEWWLENGDVYPMIIDFLVRHGAGVRNIRPPYTFSGLNNETEVLYSGEILAKTGASAHPNGLHMDFYTGLNRTRQQTANSQVILHHMSGHLDQPKYLMSIKDLRNVGTVDSNIGSVDVYYDDAVSPYLTGRARKMMYIDGGQIGDQTQATFLTGLIQKGEIELSKHNRQLVLDTGISVSTPYTYGTHYNLGDLITVIAGYGIETTMMVNEFIRTEDREGDRGFPTLVLSS